MAGSIVKLQPTCKDLVCKHSCFHAASNGESLRPLNVTLNRERAESDFGRDTVRKETTAVFRALHTQTMTSSPSQGGLTANWCGKLNTRFLCVTRPGGLTRPTHTHTLSGVQIHRGFDPVPKLTEVGGD